VTKGLRNINKESIKIEEGTRERVNKRKEKIRKHREEKYQ
jgi:hypothetical protein